MAIHFILISDLHLSHPGLKDPGLKDPGLHSDTVANLALMVARLRTIEPAPAFVVACGDLTNHGDEASYRMLAEMLAEMLEPPAIPVILALGNHDDRAAFRRVFAPDTTLPPQAPHCHFSDHGGMRIITLDSLVPGRVSGRICDRQFDFLESALQNAPELPKLLVLHHPPRTDPTALAWQSLIQSDSDRLAATLRGHRVAGILSGHVHFNRVCQWNGIPVITCNGLHATIDVMKQSGMQILEGTGFASCTYRAAGLEVCFVPLTPKPAALGEISHELLKSFQ